MLSEISQTEKEIPYDLTYMLNLNNKRTKNQACRYREQIGGCHRQGMGVSEMVEGSQKIQTSSYKISKSWGCNTQHCDYS